jgi:hypothetical protein
VKGPTATANPTLTLLCAWCRRHAHDAGGTDPRAIVGLCDEHVKGFFARVEALLASCAGLRTANPGDESEGAREETPAKALGNALRRHAGLTFCDPCLAAEVGWDVDRVTAAAGALDRSEFLRDSWRCARCGARGMVTRTRARRPTVVLDAPKAA